MHYLLTETLNWQGPDRLLLVAKMRCQTGTFIRPTAPLPYEALFIIGAQ